MAKELSNLIRFDDFKSNWKPEEFPTHTKRTDVAKDVLAKDMRGVDVDKRSAHGKENTVSNGLSKTVVDNKTGGDVFLNKSTMPDMSASKTKRTDVAKDVVKEDLENLIRFDDFKSNWKEEEFPTHTKRTDVAKDVLAKDMRGADVDKRPAHGKENTMSNGLSKTVVDNKTGGDVHLNKSTMPDMSASKTKRTDVAKDVVKESRIRKFEE